MLVGRDAEKLVIDRLLSGARVGHSAAVALIGEAGIGKSSLLAHALDVAGDMRVLRAVGMETESTLAFAGLHQLLLPVLDRLAGLLEPQREALEVALALRTGPAGERFAVGAATLALLSRVADDGPVLLVIDDAHLWDRSSLQAVGFVGRRLVADRIALLLAARPTKPDPILEIGLPRLEITGLSPAESLDLLAQRDGRFIDCELAARLQQSCGGNPLALVELTADGEQLWRLSPEVPVPVPDTVRDAFGRRVSALPHRVAGLLLLAAVADGDLMLMSQALPDGDDLDLTAAEDAGLVTLTAGRVEFRHALTRAGVYSVATGRERREAHAAVAAALPAESVERRAWHLSEATIGLDDAVADLMHSVGDRASARGATAVAATAYERAAMLARDGGGARLLAAGEAAWMSGQSERAVDLLNRAREASADVVVRAGIDGLRGRIALGAGSLQNAHRLLTGAAGELAARDPDGATMLLSDAVTACFYLADAPAALELVTALQDTVSRCQTDHAQIRGELSAGIAEILAGRPGSDRIRDAVSRMLALPDWADDQRRPSWMVLGPLFLRESMTGQRLVRHAVDELREHCALTALPEFLFHTARLAATSDNWESALSWYAEGAALARESGRSTELAMCLAGLAWLHARRGDIDDCHRHAAESTRVAYAHDLHLGLAWSMFALGDLELALGHPETALPHFERLQRLLDDRGLADIDLSPAPEITECLGRTGRPREAAEVAQRYVAGAHAKGQPWAAARAGRSLGLTDPDGGAAHFERALGLHALSPDRFEEARTQLSYGSALRRGRRKVDSRVQLRAALATFERLGARPWADAAAAELAATGEHPHRRGADQLDELTPQEMQIARLLGAGSTTREAATALFLSPKTVEYHLRHVYTKLGINSRGVLADRLGSL